MGRDEIINLTNEQLINKYTDSILSLDRNLEIETNSRLYTELLKRMNDKQPLINLENRYERTMFMYEKEINGLKEIIIDLQKENETLKANNKIPFDIFKSKEVKTAPLPNNVNKENLKVDESKIWHCGFNNTSLLFENDKTEEPEITFSEAIELIKNGRCFKVIYENGKTEYIDQYDGLDGIKFKDFFNAKFYVDTDKKIKHF
jgi:hypothetical protein